MDEESTCCSDLVSTDGQSKKPYSMPTVTGQRESLDTVDASYWVEKLLQQVRYVKAVECFFSEYDNVEGEARVPNVNLEIGPYPEPQSPTERILEQISSKSGYRPSTQVP